jgi:hypothetical protein
MTGNGTNCRIYGIKIFTQGESGQIPIDLFNNDYLKKNASRLANFDLSFLYSRAEILTRF